ncbi:DeoR/GlpR family transcriptional regulator of sugar metabolism [Paenibacillus shirakamiensis]|uniref:DeoR/GlpR family transcriptional regulator of sugar metabolism n=1 Tax=Paenibacillus shirakamiensis TaxID=1265935 RepID=A0ABS4JHA8_9BACL|nr:DeoR/GlpR family DNA-binding transcription regulator [Paenibacillus shirakamiensis]MBP2000336.1 DeoR/GlpR family transcriptional regulator of sugar metabolism [Paenibacillus shirakamiensis]
MSLVGEERKQHILNVINDIGKVRTTELVSTLGVSSETIRKYLEELEDTNRLRRVYGGAVKMSLEREELPHGQREVIHVEEKQRVGREAASRVENQDVIFIDDGSTTLQMIHFLRYKENVTIITNSVSGLNLLMEYQNKDMFMGEIIFIGGRIVSKHYRSSGSMAEAMMTGLFPNKAFVSIDGLTPHRGITSFDADRAMLAGVFIRNSAETIVLTDSSKLGVTSPYQMASLQQVDQIICDTLPPQGWEEVLKKKGTTWVVAR